MKTFRKKNYRKKNYRKKTVRKNNYRKKTFRKNNYRKKTFRKKYKGGGGEVLVINENGDDQWVSKKEAEDLEDADEDAWFEENKQAMMNHQERVKKEKKKAEKKAEKAEKTAARKAAALATADLKYFNMTPPTGILDRSMRSMRSKLHN